MQLNPAEISGLIRTGVRNLSMNTGVRTRGTVISMAGGIVRIHGLSDAMQGEMLEFPDSTFGLAMNLGRDSVGTVVLGRYERIKEGDTVTCVGRILEIPVGRELVEHVVDALGHPIDGKGPINTTRAAPIEKIAPGVVACKSVDQPTQAGLRAIGSMVPIGQGQRELIIGGRQAGKTAITLDAIVNQRDTNVICIYVAIGQKASSTASVVHKLGKYGAMEHTIVVAATTSEVAALQYIAPYAGCTMDEFFRDHGEDTLIVYDDLSEWAVAYRQISLLLHRPPGREAYPGDVFYLHSRLSEHATRINQDEVKKLTDGIVGGKTGLLTALPIIEAQAGNVSAFIPTNIISITSGQIFLEADLFNANIRPAINAGISVSRVDGAAQTKVVKKLGGSIRLALAQYRELATFSQLASDLDEIMRGQLQHGEMVTELMEQKQFCTLDTTGMALTLWVINNGSYEDVPVSKVLAFETGFLSYVRTQQSGVLDVIDSSGAMSDESEQILVETMKSFKSSYAYQT